MREKSSPFGQRRLEQQEKLPTKTQYFLAFEGEKTEKIYFDGIKEEIKAKETEAKLIKIIYMNEIRSRKKGRSHPKQVLSQAFNIKQAFDAEQASDAKQVLDKDVKQILNKAYKLGYNKNDKDKLCMIVDRDRMSFTKEQYKEVLSRCKEKEIYFYVTNPKFEFWLLLHFSSGKQLNLEKIRDPHYIDECLRTAYPKFNKKQYDFTPFKDKVPTAIENEKEFCEDEDQLEDKIGCNIGKLLTDLGMGSVHDHMA